MGQRDAPAEELLVDGGGHEHQAKVRPLGQQVPQDDEQEVAQRLPLVHCLVVLSVIA